MLFGRTFALGIFFMIWDSSPRSQRSMRSHDKATGDPVQLTSHRKTFHGHREADNQAFGFPVVGKLTFELPCHEPAHERTSEPFMFRRPVEGWAAMLFPGQQKLILLHGPIDVDVASRRR